MVHTARPCFSARWMTGEEANEIAGYSGLNRCPYRPAMERSGEQKRRKRYPCLRLRLAQRCAGLGSFRAPNWRGRAGDLCLDRRVALIGTAYLETALPYFFGNQWTSTARFAGV